MEIVVRQQVTPPGSRYDLSLFFFFFAIDTFTIVGWIHRITLLLLVHIIFHVFVFNADILSELFDSNITWVFKSRIVILFPFRKSFIIGKSQSCMVKLFDKIWKLSLSDPACDVFWNLNP